MAKPISDFIYSSPMTGRIRQSYPSEGIGTGNTGNGNAADNGSIGVVAEQAAPRLKKPPLYKVLLLNDDYTPMEFVVVMLMRIFRMSQEQAEQIMLHIHTRGLGVCGVFPREIAETKMRQVLDCAKQNQHPLQCTLERE